jgi:hypothetical protein
MTVSASDSFSHSPGTDQNLVGLTPTVGAAWATVSSTYQSNSYWQPTGVGYCYPYGPLGIAKIPTTANSADDPVTVKFTPVADSWIAGVCIRIDGSDNRYELTLHNNGNAYLAHQLAADAWQTTPIGSATAHGIAASNRTQHTIELIPTGTSLVVKVDGTTIMTETNSAISAAGYGAMLGREAFFDDFAVGTASSNPILTAAQGSLSLTGQAASLKVARVLSAAQGSYSLTGQNATLTYEQPGVYTLTAAAGSYTITGSDGLAQRAMNAGFGSYALSGQAASFTLTTPQDYTLIAAQGNYTISGKSARLQWSGEPPVIPRSFGIVMGIRMGL